MLLTLTTTHRPATDLGYLLHKNPARCQSFSLSFGKAHIFYPEASEDRCTAAMLLDVDPVAMVRGRGGVSQSVLAQYVNDRPYVASSFMSVAIAQVLGPALDGRSKERPDLTAMPIPLVAKLEVLPCRGGENFLFEVFEPLGYEIQAVRYPLDETFEEWGQSPYYSVTLSKTTTLSELLTHLYVLIPVFDNFKHYYVGDDELEKLLKHGEGWLATHPKREAITLAAICRPDPALLLTTLYKFINLADAKSEASGIEWWLELTGRGGEGMVVKPHQFITGSSKGLVQPAVKCRGREYLRIIYGPEYTFPENLSRLRKRGLATKRSLALREFALGIEGLERFVHREPLRRVHECVFGVLALESEPVDPRL